MSTTANGLDEFDILPDPFANDDLDWNQLLSAPVAAQAPSSPDYFPNDSLDESFLAELDVLENINVSSSAPTVPQSTMPLSGGTTSTVHLSHLFTSPVPPTASSPPRIGQKRARATIEPGILTPSRKANSPSSSPSGSRRKRKKGVDVPRLILAGFEEELTCPICCDIFVATHLLSPCGHSFCGDCAWQWVTKNRKTACPVCRGPLACPSMIPNISMDKTVDTHIGMLTQGHNGEAGWRTGGKMLAEFRQRQKKWKDGAAERNKIVSAVAVAVQPRIWVVVSDDDAFEADEDEDDEDEEEQNDIAFEDFDEDAD